MNKFVALSFVILVMCSFVYLTSSSYADNCEETSDCEGSKSCYYGDCLWPNGACEKAHQRNTLKGWTTYLEIYKDRACKETEEQIECAKARANGSDKSWNGYLKKYPKGSCSKEANRELKNIRIEVDRKACQKAHATRTVSGWQKYLQKYPKGECIEKAKEFITNNNPKGWSLIESGSFQMGSPSNEAERKMDEGPVHSVTISRSFLLKKTEVTQGEWRSLMGKDQNPSHFSKCGDECPVENVNWWESLAYCNALSRTEGFEECYILSGCNDKKAGEGMECHSAKFKGTGCKGYRLPTEAEWEYAARAGSSGMYYMENLDHIAWYDGNSGYEPHPVGQKIPNGWGLYDMLGNVHEWTWDWYDNYADNPDTDPLGATTGRFRVNRGGSWHSRACLCRSAFRSYDEPDSRYLFVGFRVARSLDP